MGICSCPYKNNADNNISKFRFVNSPEEMPAVANVPTPPFFGEKSGSIPLREIKPLFNQTSIIEEWGYKNRGLPLREYQELLDSGANRTYASIIKDITDNNLVDIRYKYGHFYAQGSGNFLLLDKSPDLRYSGDLTEDRLQTILFRRSPKPPFRNIPDYFHQVPSPTLTPEFDISSGLPAKGNEASLLDTVSLGAFTLGSAASETLASLLDSHDYKGYYFYHIMFSSLAIGVRNYVTNVIRGDLGLVDDNVGVSHVFSESQYTRSDDLGTVLGLLGAGSIGLSSSSVSSQRMMRGVSGRKESYRSMGSQSREGSRLDLNYSQGFIFTHHPDSVDLLKG